RKWNKKQLPYAAYANDSGSRTSMSACGAVGHANHQVFKLFTRQSLAEVRARAQARRQQKQLQQQQQQRQQQQRLLSKDGGQQQQQQQQQQREEWAESLLLSRQQQQRLSLPTCQEQQQRPGSKPKPDPYLASGLQLPPAYQRQIPPELIGKPIEEIDRFYYDRETFVIVSKGRDIFRFSATNALWCLDPFNPIRRIALYILVHPVFSLFVILTILINCGLMTLQSTELVEKTEIIFTIVYTIEMCLKVLARGLILDRFTYLRDPWNWLDFLVIAMAYLTLGVEDLGNLSVIRTFRVLRALKTVAIVPGMKTIVGAVIDSVKNLKDVVVLTLFSLSVFSLLGLQIYMGQLTQKCIKDGPANMTDDEWFVWCNNSEHWHYDDDNIPWLCGNATGAQVCPGNHTCLQGFGLNPDYGFTSFDTFGWALISSFRLMTQDFWEGLYQQILRTAGSWHIIFFIISIFLGSIYLMNLILAIVAMSYNELQRRAEEEEEAAAADEAAFLESCRLAEEQRSDCTRTSANYYFHRRQSMRPSVEMGIAGQALLAGLCSRGLLDNQRQEQLVQQVAQQHQRQNQHRYSVLSALAAITLPRTRGPSDVSQSSCVHVQQQQQQRADAAPPKQRSASIFCRPPVASSAGGAHRAAKIRINSFSLPGSPTRRLSDRNHLSPNYAHHVLLSVPARDRFHSLEPLPMVNCSNDRQQQQLNNSQRKLSSCRNSQVYSESISASTVTDNAKLQLSDSSSTNNQQATNASASVSSNRLALAQRSNDLRSRTNHLSVENFSQFATPASTQSTAHHHHHHHQLHNQHDQNQRKASSSSSTRGSMSVSVSMVPTTTPAGNNNNDQSTSVINPSTQQLAGIGQQPAVDCCYQHQRSRRSTRASMGQRRASNWSRLSTSGTVDIRRLIRLWSFTNPYDVRHYHSNGSLSSNKSYAGMPQVAASGEQQQCAPMTAASRCCSSRASRSSAGSRYAIELLTAMSQRRWRQSIATTDGCRVRSKGGSIVGGTGSAHAQPEMGGAPFDSYPYSDFGGVGGGGDDEYVCYDDDNDDYEYGSSIVSLSWRDRCIGRCLGWLDIFCIWQCCPAWLRLQAWINLIVFDPFMELFIIICIIINTLFMALDNDEISSELKSILESGNYVFTTTFAVEASMKIIALSPKFYFREGWNVFDAIIVGLSLLELGLEGVYGLSVLRTFRLLRVFKLAKSWPTLNLLISIMGKAIGDLGNLTFVLAIIVFIFAVMGMQLFGKNYELYAFRFPDHQVPRWNFTDFMHSFMIVFRILCAEWIEPMWDCLLVGGWPCIPFFLVAVVVGNLVVLNLFLALLLASFGASNLSSPQAESVDTKKLHEAIDRFARASRWLMRKLNKFRRWLTCYNRRHNKTKASKIVKLSRRLKRKQANNNNNSGSNNSTQEQQQQQQQQQCASCANASQLATNKQNSATVSNLCVPNIPIIVESESHSSLNQLSSSNSDDRQLTDDSASPQQAINVCEGSELRTEASPLVQCNDNQQQACYHVVTIYEPPGGDGNGDSSGAHGSGPNGDVLLSIDDTSANADYDDDNDHASTPLDARATDSARASSDECTSRVDKNFTDLNKETDKANNKQYFLQAPDKIDMNEDDELELERIGKMHNKCCAAICYQRLMFRLLMRRIVENRYFDTVIIVMIIVSSCTLALEDVHLKYRPTLKMWLDILDTVFTVAFTLEMLMKWSAFGLRRYFGNISSWVDFAIVVVSLVNLIASVFGTGKIQALKTMRTLRAMRGLRPLRALSRFQGMRVVVNALIQAIPAIFNVLLVCLIFWLIFSIMGVQMFGGKFQRCVDSRDQIVDYNEVPTRQVCLAKNYTWSNPQINFDNVLNAYLALFQVATFKGWIDIMNSATDSRLRDDQPSREANIYMYFYFVFFVIIGSFFTLNLFIGVIIDNFNEQKRKTGGSLEIFMTEDQKKYYNAMKKMRNKKPVKAVTRPKFKLQAHVFDVISSKRFDMAIMLIIALNMFVMSLEYYGQSAYYTLVLERLNLMFIAIFSCESLAKIFALRHYYFREPWNVFDTVVVVLSIAGVVMKEWISKYFVSPTLLRVVRVVKVGRVLRLVKGAKGIRTLLFALAMSLPALLNICLLLFLVMFIYAIFGMSFFMNVRPRAGIDDTFNFRTFFSSLTLLFQMSTSAGWDLVLDPLIDEKNDCQPPDPANGIEGTCGNKGIAIAYLVSYVIVTFLIIINMYIAVILENYSLATEEVQEGLTDDDYDMYYEIWQRFDPRGTQFLPYDKLSDFVDALEDPLRIPKPNRLALAVMDINIYKGNVCYCVDILDALTKHFFISKGLVIQGNEQLQQVQTSLHKAQFEKLTTTFLLQRHHYCAKLIQNSWRKWKARALQQQSSAKQSDTIVAISAQDSSHLKTDTSEKNNPPSSTTTVKQSHENNPNNNNSDQLIVSVAHQRLPLPDNK
ncbi:Sodium channel protein type 10 subunit alpha, partial [Fragariocoptes setiger]